MARLKNLPFLERPREKALRHGIESLSNCELLALIIGSGYKGTSAIEIASNIISDFGGLSSLYHKKVEEIAHYKGIGKAVALRLIASFELGKRYHQLNLDMENLKATKDYLFRKYQPIFSSLRQEMVILVTMNHLKKIIHEEKIYIGGETNVMFSPELITKKVIQQGGTQFYILHNHPNNSMTPSNEDFMATSELLSETKRMRIRLCDHLIVTDQGYYSFKENKSYFRKTKKSC